jgi:hypothetical protein
MTVYVAWAPDLPPLADLAGPWTELKLAAPGLLLVESDDTLSRVFHELKWALPQDAPLFVAPVGDRPKLRHLADGTLGWLRRRIPLDHTRFHASKGIR